MRCLSVCLSDWVKNLKLNDSINTEQVITNTSLFPVNLLASNAGIPRRRHGHRHRHRLAKHGYNLTSDTRYFLARPREEIACVGRKIVAVFGESVSVSMSVSASWNASLTDYWESLSGTTRASISVSGLPDRSCPVVSYNH